MPLGEKALALPECQVFRGSGLPGDVCFMAAGRTGTGLPFRVEMTRQQVARLT